MKKVLFVITKSNWGGAGRYVFDLATSLPKDRFEVAVVFGRSGELATRLEAAHIRTFSLSSMQRDISLMADLKSCIELYRIFKREHPDCIHLNSSKAGGIGALAGRLAGVSKIIFTVHGLPEDEVRNPLSRLLIKLATRLTFLLCDIVITVSKDNHARVQGSVLIYNGVRPEELGSGAIIRRAFPEGVRITGTIGELTWNKNQIALIERARQDPSLYIAIVGEGELRPLLEEKIKEYGLQDRVKLFGFIPAKEVLRGFDVFTLPSRKEGLPYVLLEAKQAGLPIEANRVGGVGEILDAPDMSEFSIEKMVERTAALYTS